MQNFTVSSLCRAVGYKSNITAFKTFNYHCEHCRKCSGAPYLTNIFFKNATLDIQGNLKNYIHKSESGNKINKKCCRQCFCQMFSFNEGRPRFVKVHTGTENELEVVKPQGDIWPSKKILSIRMDETLDQFQRNFT